MDYVKLAATAQRLVEANGRAVTIYKRNRTPANASEPWRGSSATPAPPDGLAIGPVEMAFVPPSGSGFGKLLADSDELLLKDFDQVGLLAADTVADAGYDGDDIEQADTVDDGGRTWRVNLVRRLRPAGTDLLYALGLKS